MAPIVDRAHPTDPRLNRAFAEYAQARGFVIDPARVCVGDGWVGGVELVEIDAIEPEPAQRCLAGGAKVVGAAVGRPADQLSRG
jgi:hypothetical protein